MVLKGQMWRRGGKRVVGDWQRNYLMEESSNWQAQINPNCQRLTAYVWGETQNDASIKVLKLMRQVHSDTWKHGHICCSVFNSWVCPSTSFPQFWRNSLLLIFFFFFLRLRQERASCQMFDYPSFKIYVKALWCQSYVMQNIWLSNQSVIRPKKKKGEMCCGNTCGEKQIKFMIYDVCSNSISKGFIKKKERRHFTVKCRVGQMPELFIPH